MHNFRLLAPIALAFGLLSCAASAGEDPCPVKPSLVRPLVEALTPAPRPDPNRPVVMEVSEIERFCNDAATEAVLCSGGDPAQAGQMLTAADVARVDATLRAVFHYRDDAAFFGRSDFWHNDTRCGDCEDYALTVSEMLAKAGQGGDKMALMIWSPDRLSGHATLLVETSDAGILEIGVSPTEGPRLFNERLGVRLGYVLMDGRLNMTLYPGVEVWRDRSWLMIGEEAAAPAPAN